MPGKRDDRDIKKRCDEHQEEPISPLWQGPLYLDQVLWMAEIAWPW